MLKTPPKKADIRNRVVERRRMDASALASNGKNWREHPPEQQAALKGILDEVGQVGELYAYYSERNGNKLTLIDGHLRTEIGGEWDVAITDLDDAEADKLLLTYDPLAAMATANKERLDSLMRSVETRSEGVKAMLDELAQRNGVPPGSVSGVGMPDLPNGEKTPFQQMTFTLHDDQAEQVKAAIRAAVEAGPFVDAANENSNGNALARIAEAYLGRG